jgi:hypothetical protein
LVVGILVSCASDSREDASATLPTSAGLVTGDPSGTGSSTTDDSSSDSSDEPKLDVGAGTGGPPMQGDDSACPCGENADLIYVLSDQATLFTYNPATNSFNPLGAFNCPGSGAFDTTFSMGVARSGIAWVMYTPSGDIFHVDVNDANVCTDPGYEPGYAGFTLFGMAFVSQSLNSPCDTLYAHSFSGGLGGFSEGAGSGQLGKVVDLLPQYISTIDYDGGELTGTGDGRLFAFAGTNPAKLVEYDKTDGSVIETTQLNGLELTNAFAFAFWGGDFYFFTEGDGFSGTSKVTRLDHDGDGSLATINTDAPIRIVGAGVSTCAPIVPPG